MIQEYLKLLVSVRSVDEALLALHAGARILDVKEPRRGSLGMADSPMLFRIVDACRRQSPDVPLSAALGELCDWTADMTPPLPEGLTFAKLGLSRLRSKDWVAPWLRLRERVDRSVAANLHWIAVVYADSVAAGSPPPSEIVDAAIDTGCRGVLFDTWSKSSGNLWAHLPAEDLVGHLRRTRDAGLVTAVAGGLDVAALDQIQGLPIDIVAVRGAACITGVRTTSLCPDKIRQLSERLEGIANRPVLSCAAKGEC